MAQLKVFHKGLILVGVPLLIELLMIGSLWLLLVQSDKEKATESVYRRYAAVNARLMTACSEAPYMLFASIQYQSDKLFKNYEKKMKEIHECGDELTELVDKHPDLDIGGGKAMKANIDKMLGMMEEIGEARKGSNLLDLLRSAPELKEQFENNKDITTQKLAELVDQGEKQTILTQNRQQNIRNWQAIIVGAGVVLNLSIGIALAIFYKREIMDRLKRITNNTVALSKGKRLSWEVGGSDEIALLDQAFHSMHKQLMASSERERALFNNASDVICVLDANNRFSKVNPIALQYWGYDPSELIGSPLSDLVVPADLTNTEDLIMKAKISKEPVTFENKLKTRKGKIIDVLWSAYWSESELSLFCIVHDMTEIKQVEQVRKQFLSMISSDLKTPLSSISASVSQLVSDLKEAMPQMAVEKLDMAKKNVQRLLGLVNDLLQITEMDSGNLEIRKETGSIDEILRRSIQDVEAIADKQKVKLQVIPVEGIWYVDPNRIMQVLVNLLSNAIKFSPTDGVVTLLAEKQGDYILCKIIDQGRGVPETHKKAIFEKFKQVEAADGKRKSGTGLGLPICKQIVEEHGGLIGVDSVEGKGSTFWFRVPVDETVSMRIRAQTKASQAAELAAKQRADAMQKVKAQEQQLPAHKRRPKGGSKVKLAWKGAILIGIPILFELVFVGALASVLVQVDKERQIELHNRMIAFDATKLMNVFFKAAVVMASARTAEGWRTFQAAFEEANKIREELRTLVGDDPESLEHFNKMEESATKLTRFFEKAQEVMGSSRRIRVDRMGEAFSGKDKLVPIVISVAHRLQVVVDDAEAKEFDSPSKQKALRAMQGQVLLAGLAANILVSLLLTVFFTRGITSRLTVLADNADRLAKDKELNPQIAGSDEIAQLDRIFHITATALAEARQKERAVFDNSQDVICALSGSGQFTSLNPACEKSWGYERDSLMNKPFLDIIHPDDQEATAKVLAGDFGETNRIDFENRVVKKDGSFMNVLWSASRQKGNDTTYCIAHDITNRKELEQLKQEFLAMVSHDLRTPLTSITGIAKLIIAGAFGKVEEKPMSVLKNITRNGDKLLELINDLLDIEKLESGHMQLVLEPVKLKDLVEKSIAASGDAARVRMEFHGNKPDIELMADKDRLIQALGNIASHAITRSAEGTQVRFLCRNTEDAIEFQIIDTAPPMSEKSRNQLFNRFKDMTALQDASVEERLGTGLALPIASKIIESHAGVIEILGNGPTGNVYFIRVPLDPKAVTAPAAVTTKA